jgi:alkylation response protein AidB-like acyl-CoA dehydrogenase
VARAARDWLAQYLNERTPSNLGAPLATLPRFQTAVGEIDALLLANRRLVYGLAEQVDADGSGAAETSTVKYLATTNAIRAVDIALALIGNPGLSRHNPLERHHRDVLCSRIHSPQDDMVLLGLGKAALGR